MVSGRRLRVVVVAWVFVACVDREPRLAPGDGPVAQAGGLIHATCSRDGGTLFVAATDGTVAAWPIRADRPVAALAVDGVMASVTFDPVGGEVVALGRQGAVWALDFAARRVALRRPGDERTRLVGGDVPTDGSFIALLLAAPLPPPPELDDGESDPLIFGPPVLHYRLRGEPWHALAPYDGDSWPPDVRYDPGRRRFWAQARDGSLQTAPARAGAVWTPAGASPLRGRTRLLTRRRGRVCATSEQGIARPPWSRPRVWRHGISDALVVKAVDDWALVDRVSGGSVIFVGGGAGDRAAHLPSSGQRFLAPCGPRAMVVERERVVLVDRSLRAVEFPLTGPRRAFALTPVRPTP